MAKISPLAAIRPRNDLAAQIISLPYDVLSSNEAKLICSNNPQSFLRVTKAEVDLPDDVSAGDERIYRCAKQRLLAMKAMGELSADSEEKFYVYQLQWRGRVQTGLVALASVEEYLNGDVRKHELTRPDKEDDRTQHILQTGCQTGPVFLTYRATDKTNKLFKQVLSRVPDIDVCLEDDVTHRLWLIDNFAVAEWQAAMAEVPRLYIADGHHRSAAAARVAMLTKEDRAQNFLAVIFPADQLEILAYNRVIKDLNGLYSQDFLRAVEKVAEVEEFDGCPELKNNCECGMYLAGQWYMLRMSPIASGVLQELPVNILQDNILCPLLSIKDPRTDKRIDFVGGIRGWQELVKLVDSGDYAVAFLLYPTQMEQLLAVADADEIMPPKSTWFEPKLRDGLVIHEIGE